MSPVAECRRLRICAYHLEYLRWPRRRDSGAGGSVRSLLVADDVPWPPLGGALVRLAQVVEAVASVSDLDLFVLHNQHHSKVEVPPTIPVVRSKGVQYPRTSAPPRWRLEWAARRGLPVEVVMSRADRGAPGRTPRLGPSAL